MRNTNIIVAFRDNKISDTIVNLLYNSSFNNITQCCSGSEVRKQISYLSEGILICGYSLTDTSIISLIDDIPENFNVILIGSYSQINMCDSERVFKLAVPLSKTDLIYSITMLTNVETTYSSPSVPIRTEKENAIVEEAKHLLIEKYNLSEEQAHRYMQKKSMSSGVKLVEIAKIILN